MTLVLRKARVQARIEGLDPRPWSEDDYDAVDEITVGRIYMEQLLGELKWRWFLTIVPATPPNQRVADTLDEAKAASPSDHRRHPGLASSFAAPGNRLRVQQRRCP